MMSTNGLIIRRSYGSVSPRRREVVSTVERPRPPIQQVNEENRHSGLKRLKSRSWSSIRRWEKENELLFAMIEDESNWLSELFSDEIIAPEFFFFSLEDGVLLCKLALLIQEYADKYGEENKINIPKYILKFHPRSRTRGQLGQFRARENVTEFLTWCRKHCVPEVILFESNDVVQTEDFREGAREVVICLMEIARRATKYGVKPPQLIVLEKEIEIEERQDECSSPTSVDSGVETENYNENKRLEHVESNNQRSSIDQEFDNTDGVCIQEKDQHTAVSDSCTENETIGTKQGNKQQISDPPQKPQTELDKKVLNLINEYSVGKVTRLKEGKYIILGRVMFIRMLNEHVLVRIGGGWDGLEHYLMTHVREGVQTPKAPAADSVASRSCTPKLDLESRLQSRVLSRREKNTAASTPSLVDINKTAELRCFTPPLPSTLTAKGRDIPIRKTSRVKDTDEADIVRAIRKIETAVSDNISKKTASTTSLNLTPYSESCKDCSKNRRRSKENMDFDSQNFSQIVPDRDININDINDSITSDSKDFVNDSNVNHVDETLIEMTKPGTDANANIEVENENVEVANESIDVTPDNETAQLLNGHATVVGEANAELCKEDFKVQVSVKNAEATTKGISSSDKKPNKKNGVSSSKDKKTVKSTSSPPSKKPAASASKSAAKNTSSTASSSTKVGSGGKNMAQKPGALAKSGNKSKATGSTSTPKSGKDLPDGAAISKSTKSVSSSKSTNAGPKGTKDAAKSKTEVSRNGSKPKSGKIETTSSSTKASAATTSKTSAATTSKASAATTTTASQSSSKSASENKTAVKTAAAKPSSAKSTASKPSGSSGKSPLGSATKALSTSKTAAPAKAASTSKAASSTTAASAKAASSSAKAGPSSAKAASSSSKAASSSAKAASPSTKAKSSSKTDSSITASSSKPASASSTPSSSKTSSTKSGTSKPASSSKSASSSKPAASKPPKSPSSSVAASAKTQKSASESTKPTAANSKAAPSSAKSTAAAKKPTSADKKPASSDSKHGAVKAKSPLPSATAKTKTQSTTKAVSQPAKSSSAKEAARKTSGSKSSVKETKATKKADVKNTSKSASTKKTAEKKKAEEKKAEEKKSDSGSAEERKTESKVENGALETAVITDGNVIEHLNTEEVKIDVALANINAVAGDNVSAHMNASADIGASVDDSADIGATVDDKADIGEQKTLQVLVTEHEKTDTNVINSELLSNEGKSCIIISKPISSGNNNIAIVENDTIEAESITLAESVCVETETDRIEDKHDVNAIESSMSKTHPEEDENELIRVESARDADKNEDLNDSVFEQGESETLGFENESRQFDHFNVQQEEVELETDNLTADEQKETITQDSDVLDFEQRAGKSDLVSNVLPEMITNDEDMGGFVDEEIKDDELSTETEIMKVIKEDDSQQSNVVVPEMITSDENMGGFVDEEINQDELSTETEIMKVIKEDDSQQSNVVVPEMITSDENMGGFIDEEIKEDKLFTETEKMKVIKEDDSQQSEKDYGKESEMNFDEGIRKSEAQRLDEDEDAQRLDEDVVTYIQSNELLDGASDDIIELKERSVVQEKNEEQRIDDSEKTVDQDVLEDDDGQASLDVEGEGQSEEKSEEHFEQRVSDHEVIENVKENIEESSYDKEENEDFTEEFEITDRIRDEDSSSIGRFTGQLEDENGESGLAVETDRALEEECEDTEQITVVEDVFEVEQGIDPEEFVDKKEKKQQAEQEFEETEEIVRVSKEEIDREEFGLVSEQDKEIEQRFQETERFLQGEQICDDDHFSSFKKHKEEEVRQDPEKTTDKISDEFDKEHDEFSLVSEQDKEIEQRFEETERILSQSEHEDHHSQFDLVGGLDSKEVEGISVETENVEKDEISESSRHVQETHNEVTFPGSQDFQETVCDDKDESNGQQAAVGDACYDENTKVEAVSEKGDSEDEEETEEGSGEMCQDEPQMNDDASSGKFDETKLEALEEISAKCSEEDIREGAIAPTPPETPVSDSVPEASFAESALKLEQEVINLAIAAHDEKEEERNTPDEGDVSLGVVQIEKGNSAEEISQDASVLPESLEISQREADGNSFDESHVIVSSEEIEQQRNYEDDSGLKAQSATLHGEPSDDGMDQHEISSSNWENDFQDEQTESDMKQKVGDDAGIEVQFQEKSEIEAGDSSSKAVQSIETEEQSNEDSLSFQARYTETQDCYGEDITLACDESDELKVTDEIKSNEDSAKEQTLGIMEEQSQTSENFLSKDDEYYSHGAVALGDNGTREDVSILNTEIAEGEEYKDECKEDELSGDDDTALSSDKDYQDGTKTVHSPLEVTSEVTSEATFFERPENNVHDSIPQSSYFENINPVSENMENESDFKHESGNTVYEEQHHEPQTGIPADLTIQHTDVVGQDDAPYTPVSDLTEGLTSPLAHASFYQSIEKNYEHGEDETEEPDTSYDSDVLKDAQESLKLAHELDDSYQEESRAIDYSLNDENDSTTEAFGSGDVTHEIQDDSSQHDINKDSYDNAAGSQEKPFVIRPNIISSPVMSSDSESEDSCDNEDVNEEANSDANEISPPDAASAYNATLNDQDNMQHNEDNQEYFNESAVSDINDAHLANLGNSEASNDQAFNGISSESSATVEDEDDMENYGPVEHKEDSDERATDGSDFVLLDSPSKEDKSLEDTVLKGEAQGEEEDGDTSDNSPFHHIEVQNQNVVADVVCEDDMQGSEGFRDEENLIQGYADNQLDQCMNEPGFVMPENAVGLEDINIRTDPVPAPEDSTEFSINTGSTGQPSNNDCSEYTEFNVNVVSGNSSSFNSIQQAENHFPRYVYDASDDEEETY